MELALALPTALDFTDWLRKARAGSTGALGRMLEQLAAAALVRCAQLQIGRDVQKKVAANDLVQDTMVKAIKDFSGFVGSTAQEFESWLVSILLRTACNARRHYRAAAKRQVSRETSLDAPGRYQGLRDELEARGPTPSQIAEENEMRERLTEVVRRLPDRQRQVVTLRNDQGLSFEEIGQQVGCAAEAARKLYHRVFKEIVVELGG